jgi:hypothetical protein
MRLASGLNRRGQTMRPLSQLAHAEPLPSRGPLRPGGRIACDQTFIRMLVVISSDLLMQAFGGVSEEVPVLVNRASLHLADRPAEQGRERPPHPACVDAGQVGAGDHRVGSERPALIGPQRLAFPLGSFAVRAGKPGTGNGDLGLAEVSAYACASHDGGQQPLSYFPRRPPSSPAGHSADATTPRRARRESSPR